MKTNYILRTVLIVPTAIAALACGKGDKPADQALNNDLSLASQSQASARLDSISAAERTAAMAPAKPAPETVYKTRTRYVEPTHHTSSASRAASTPAPAPEPTYHTEKNTNRDAAIGGGAGAILGAVTSKNKVKGAVLGGAAGALLGGVLGNNVDKKKVPNQ